LLALNNAALNPRRLVHARLAVVICPGGERLSAEEFAKGCEGRNMIAKDLEHRQHGNSK
jgi:hypothetical protein